MQLLYLRFLRLLAAPGRDGSRVVVARRVRPGHVGASIGVQVKQPLACPEEFDLVTDGRQYVRSWQSLRLLTRWAP